MTVEAVIDPIDPRLIDYQCVWQPALAERRGVFVAEGRTVVRRLLESTSWRAASVLVTQPALDALREAFAAHASLPVYLVTQAVMNDITRFNIHRGCLAIGARRPLPSWQELAAKASRLLVLDHVGDADNVGALFRNAAAFGVDAVLLGPACADPLYRKAIRTSMAATFAVPFAPLEPWPTGLGDLRAAGWHVVGTTPAARATPLDEVAQTIVGGRVALVVGHEGTGLSVGALDACDVLVRIPTTSNVDSLNVATAGAIALYALRDATRS